MGTIASGAKMSKYSLLYRKVRRKYDDDIQRSLQYILAKGQIGDWFVLYQLSKNCNVYFFREFIRELAIDLKEKPKKSKSIGYSSGSMKKQKSIQQDVEIDMSFGNNDDNSDDSDLSDSQASSQAYMLKSGDRSKDTTLKKKKKSTRKK